MLAISTLQGVRAGVQGFRCGMQVGLAGWHAACVFAVDCAAVLNINCDGRCVQQQGMPQRRAA